MKNNRCFSVLISFLLSLAIISGAFFVSADTVNNTSLSSSDYTISDGYIYIHTPGKSVSDVLDAIGNNAVIYNLQNKAVSAGIVGTGMRAVTTVDNITSNSSLIVVNYDLDGDGTVNATDISLLKRNLLGTDTLNLAQQKAITGDSSDAIDIRDLIRIKKYLADPATPMYLNYSNGLSSDLQYNTSLYGMNFSNDVEGADPGCFFVSEDEDSEYGGYYYMYKSGSTFDANVTVPDEYAQANQILGAAYMCYRSKDLYNWESCGNFAGGYSLGVTDKDWCRSNFWAPEVIRNPADGKYYMYFSAAAPSDWGVAGMSSSANVFDRLYLGVAVADMPVGPFNIIFDSDAGTGKRIPTINFRTGCNTTYNWAAIDASPFFDDNGDLYLYFNKHTDDHYNSLKGVWGMKMTSMSNPDYSTVSCLAVPGKVTVSNTKGSIEKITKGSNYYDSSEGNINEAPFMLKHNGKYYLTYASNGCTCADYSVHQAIGNSPLGTFVKVSDTKGNPVLRGDQLGYVNGTAHHSFVNCGDELWIVYHKHNSLQGMEKGWDRSISVDRANFVTNDDGIDIITVNGPSKILQWLPYSVSGYENLAKTAEISVSGGNGVSYLNDQILPFNAVTESRVFSAQNSDVTITLKWHNPVNVSSVMVYNAFYVNKAFSNISEISLGLVGLSQKTADIKNLRLPQRYIDNYVNCAPAVADFDSVYVNELKIKIRNEDKIVSGSTVLNLSEIVVLGSTGEVPKYNPECNSFCSAENDSDIAVDGVLNEPYWQNGNWFTSTYDAALGVATPQMKVTGFTTEKGLYIAAETNDTNLVNDGDHTVVSNSAFVFSIVADDINKNNPLYVTDAVIDMRGDCHTSRESNFKRAIKANGVLNSGNTAGATLEAFFPWSSLQIDPKNGLPDTFSVISSFRAVLPGDAECTASNYVVAKCSADRSTPLAENALFANSVAVNGSRVYSATDRWDISELSNNVLNGSYEMGSSLYPMYFSKQGNRMLISTTVEYTTDIDSVGVSNCQSDLLAGIMLSSGSNNGWIGVRQSGIVYNEHWITNVIPYDVLTTWARNYTKIKLEVLLINGNLFFCVDNSYVTRVAVSDVVSDTDGNSNFAIGLIMGADKTANAQFSNISFTTDSAELGRFIDKYEIPEEKPYDPSVQSYIQYARALGKGYKNGNSETVAVLNENTTVFIGDSFFDGRQFWTDFYDDDYKNANAFLAGIGSTTVDNWLNLKDEVLAGFKDCSPKNIVMHLGTNSLWDDSATPESVASELKELFNRLHESYPTSNIYYFSITHRDIGEDNDRIDAVNSIISSWCETKPYVTFINTANRITSSILYDQIHPRLGCYSIFTEELQKAGCVILDNNGNTYIPPASETALFADYITLNGKSFASALDKWATGKEGVAKASYENGCALKPVYFSATGNKALLETTVKCTTNFSAGNYETIPMAGITVTDGINSGILGIRQNSIVYNERIIQPAINYDTLSSWDLNHHSVDLKIALNNGKFYVYVDDVFITGIAVSDVVTGADENAELAVGLIMNADRNASLEFGNISFVTDESKVNEFLGTRNSLFVTRVPLGANIAWSSLGSWDQSKIAENTLTATNTLNSSWQPAYFAEFGNAGLMHATVTRTDNIGESGATGDPIAALKVSDGINGNCYIGVRQNAVIYTGDIAIWGTLPSYVLTTWSSLEDLSFELDIALKDGYFYLYIDGIYVTKIELSKVVPGATPNTDLAFGITSYTGGKAEIEFSNISFTTDKAKISAFLEK